MQALFGRPLLAHMRRADECVVAKIGTQILLDVVQVRKLSTSCLELHFGLSGKGRRGSLSPCGGCTILYVIRWYYYWFELGEPKILGYSEK